MKQSLPAVRIILMVIVLLLPGVNGFTATRTASKTGNWSNTATWGGQPVPTALDDVFINSRITLTVDITAVCQSLTFNPVSRNTYLIISGTNSLTVTGLVFMPTPSKNRSCNIDVGDGVLTCGSLTLNSSSKSQRDIVTIGTGTLSVSGAITAGSSVSQFIFSDAGRMNIGGAFTGTPTFTTFPGSTVNYYSSLAQTVRAVPYSNLILGGSGSKTTTGVTVNAVLSMEGQATASAAPTYGANATLQYNTAVSHTSGNEWVTPFTATGGILVSNTGIITLNAAKTLNTSIPLTIASGASFSTNNWSLTFGGDFINNGNFNGGSSTIAITGAAAVQNIGSFTTSGNIIVSKTGGTAYLNGNVGGSTLSFAGANNAQVSLASESVTLTLSGGLSMPVPTGSPITLAINGGTLSCSSITLGGTGVASRATTVSLSSGTINVAGNIVSSGVYSNFTFTDAGDLNIGGSFMTGTPGTFTPSMGTVNYNANGNQTVGAFTYNNLTLSGSGLKTINAGTTVATNFAITGATKASLANGSTIPVNSLWFIGTFQVSGTWGSTNSSASNKNDTYFDVLKTGILNVATGTKLTPAFSSLSASQTVPHGTATITLNGKLSAPGPIYPAIGELVTITINGMSQSAAISTATGGFSYNFPTAAIPYSAIPYPITYSYPGNVNLYAAPDNSTTTLTLVALVITSPTVTAISSNSARLGGNITNDGGSNIIERGTVWKTTAGVVITDNKLAEGGITTGVYSHVRTSLPIATQIFFRAYATNSYGTVLSAESSFYTLSNEPTVQATNVSFSNVDSDVFTITWTPGNGTQSIVLVKSGVPIATAPVDGITYTANSIFGSGSSLGSGSYVVYNSTGNSVTVSGLVAGDIYYVGVYTFNGSGPSTNYLITNPALGNQELLIAYSGDYRSAATGNWTTTSSWEKYNGTAWVSASKFPNSSDGTITIRDTHVITLTGASVTVDELFIEPEGKLVVNLNPGGYSFTIANDPDLDMEVSGIFEFRGTAVQFASGAELSIAEGGIYQANLNYAGGGAITIPTANWDINSTCEILSCNDLPIANGLNQDFGNFTWNSSVQNADINLGGLLTRVLGDFTVINTNNRKLFLTNNTGLTFMVGNDFIVEGGFLDFSGNSAPTKILNIGGNFLQTGGTFTNSNSNTLTVNFLGTANTFEYSGGILTNTYIDWSIPAGSYITLNSDLPVASGRNTTVTGSLECPEGKAVTGAGQFILSAGADLILGSPAGISASGATGNIQTTTRSLSTSGNYTYNGLSAQITGNGLPGQVHNLTIDNSAGVTQTGPTSISNILFLTQGILSTNGNLLTLLSTASQTALVDATGAGDVTGRVIMQRYLPSGFGYKFFSSPFKTSTVNEFSNDLDLGASFPTFYRYDENRVSAGWVNYTATAGFLEPLEGYAANFGTSVAPKTVDIGGELNRGPVQKTVLNHNQPYTLGFNLVGNPYPSPIDWDSPSSGWTRINIDNAVYYFDFTNVDQYSGTYSSYIGGVSSDGIANNLIPAMQGFFVHVSNGTYPVTGTFGMTDQVRVNDPNPFFHKSAQQEIRPIIRLTARFEKDSSKTDATVVYFDPLATAGFNWEKDALKMLNTDPAVPSLYSLADDNQWLSINGLPNSWDSIREIPLGLTTLQPGMVVIRASDMERIPDGVHVYLYDSETGMNQDMQNSLQYRVFLPKGEFSNRFWLKISQTDLVNKPETGNMFLAYCSGDELRIKLMLEPGENALLTVCNTTGQIVWRQDVGGVGYGEIVQHLTSGIYVVSLYRSTGIQSQKVFIPFK